MTVLLWFVLFGCFGFWVSFLWCVCVFVGGFCGFCVNCWVLTVNFCGKCWILTVNIGRTKRLFHRNKTLHTPQYKQNKNNVHEHICHNLGTFLRLTSLLI